MNKLFVILYFIFIPGVLFAAPPSSVGSSEYHFLAISDTHLGVAHKMDILPTGYDYKNDLDDNTFKLLLGNISNLVDENTITPQSVLLLGDLVDHVDGNVDEGSYSGRKKQLAKNFSIFDSLFNSLPIFYAFGNNDSLSGDYQSFYTQSKYESSPWEVARKNGWNAGFSSNDLFWCKKPETSFPCLVHQVVNKKNGFYSVELAPKLRLLVINSILFDRRDKSYHGENYNGELQWFQNQLKQAVKQGDSVLIAMHIPPGTNLYSEKLFWQEEAQNKFFQIINTFQVNIVGILASHTHMDELKALVKNNKTLVPVIIVPGLSTSHGNAPAFKYFTLKYNNKNNQWKMTNFETYSFLSKKFKKLYSFQSYYCPGKKFASVGECLNFYIEKGDLQNLLTKMIAYYAAGNPNYSSAASDFDKSNILIL